MSVKSSLDDFIKPNKHLLNFVGFWPRSHDLSKAYRLFATFRIVISSLAVSTMFVPEILALIIYRNDITKIIDIGSIIIEVVQLVFKMFYMLIRQEKFSQIYKSARKLWHVTDDEEERENFEKLAALANRLTITLFLVIMSNIFTFVTASIVITFNNYKQANGSDYTRFLPLEMWYGVDTQRSPNYEIAVLGQTIGMIFSVVGVAGFDATMVTLILHVSGQFRLISARFRNFGNYMKNESMSELRMKIGRYIDHHNLVLRVATDLRDLLSPVIFVQLMSSGLEICLCGYMLVMKGGNRGEMGKYIIYTLSIFLQLVLWCWPGELLIQESTAIGDVIFHELPWYKLPADWQRDLTFVIIRARKRCCVTALSFQVMSMSKVAEVFNNAVSYFALLRSVSDI